MQLNKGERMAKDFHNKPFDDETILKLEIFRGYIREWLPVFLSKTSFKTINIFDFFAGPGKDSNGQAGSPLIIIDETNKYLADPKLYQAKDVSIQLFFNDDDPEKISLLEEEISLKNTEAFEVKTINQEFHPCFNIYQSILSSTSAAKLVILDQCGVKQIPPAIFERLINSPTTDFMFFVSSSILSRFITTDEVGRHFPGMSSEAIKAVPSTDIHRFVCQYYQKLVPQQMEYYLSPFSIKKGSNIYGIIFGSSNLYGLEKFLKTCWDNDQISGEANYDIDDDMVRNGQTLFPELDVSKKIGGFEKKLIEFLQEGFRSNNDLYKFTLEYGCLPKHTRVILQKLQKEESIQIRPSDIRRGSFYINWENYRKQEVKTEFCMKEQK